MNIEILESELIRVIRERKILEVKYQSGGARTVEPHILYKDRKGVKCLGVFQRAGDSVTGEESGWKTFHVASIENFKILEQTFRVREEFDGDDRVRYPFPIACVQRDGV